MWRNVLSDEGQRIVKKAERAQGAGDYGLAREFYLRAISKFREASEISEDFKEIGILRTLISYYNDRVSMLEEELVNCPSPDSHLELKPVEKETPASDVKELLQGSGVTETVFGTVLAIAIEISREGREGHTIGTGFLVGDTANIMAKSRQLVFNPFEGHSRERRVIADPETRDNIKEFAQLDGVFVIAADGVVEAAGRYITIDTGIVKLQRGLGTRHSSVAAITSVTRALGIVVSQSGGVIRIFKEGMIFATIKP
ncbi:MAG: diadenylate cyclase [Candidatus Methanoperedens sp.]|nr:diadenylate cyclase [Candidatus Methanoperedens sp.]